MADVKCRYCGEAFTVDLAPGQDPEALPPGSRVCGSCSSRQREVDEADGTVMLPPEEANVLGHPASTPAKPTSKRDSQASGRTFGRYEIIEEISRGSFGVVYRAQQKGLDRVVALKVLLAGAHASSDMVARFQREARAAARVKHPCIVPIYDIGSEDEHHYFAMEFIEGEALSARIQRGLTTSETLAIAEDLADAMETAHQQGVVHRDLKPSNIILDSAGRPHITDFGLAKQVDLDTRYTQSGTTLGTPAYMPPEQARGEIETVDARSDVYALGAILYEMLTGAPPFGGRSLLEVVVAVLNEPVRPPRQINPKIHRDVQTIVLKCLEKQPGQRYASAGELRDDIRHFRSGEAIRARPIGPLRQAGRFVRRHAFFFLAVATVLLAVGLSVWHVRRMQQQLDTEIEKERQAQAARQRIERQKEIISTRPEWKPFWWFPEKPEDNLAPDERLLIQRGFIHPNGPVPDWAAGRDIVLSPARALVSPEEKRIFGDLEARLRFRLSPQAAGQGVRVGIQSFEGALPYVLAIRPGRLTLIGPTDLYSTGNQARSPLIIKAEKLGPALVAGEYQLVVRREGLNLSFQLQGPEGSEPVRMSLWDLGLSHWKFKNTQVTIREAPEGFEILEVTVLRKSSPERLDDLSQALSYFHNGEYNGAEAELDAIVSKKAIDEKDLLKVAQADFYLGLIQEVCQPNLGAEVRHYARALDTLSRCPNSHESRSLEARVRLRRLLLFARQERWARAEDERGQLADLASDLPTFPPAVPGIGEPYAWELVPLLVSAAQKNEPEPKELAFALFKILGLAPGSEQLAHGADALGRYLVSTQRYDALLALHKAHPTPALLRAFAQAIASLEEAGERERSFELLTYATRSFPGQEAALESAGSALLKRALADGDLALSGKIIDLLPRPALATTFRQFLERIESAPGTERLSGLAAVMRRIKTLDLSAEERKALTASVVRLAGLLQAESRWAQLQDVHAMWPAPELAPVVAKSIQSLATAGTVEAEDAALALLRYAYASPLRESAEVQAAAMEFAHRGAGARGEESYALILSVHRAFPTPKLLDLAADAMRELIRSRSPSQALSFFASARVEFGPQAERLMPSVVEILRTLPVDQASQALTDLRSAVRQPLQGRPLEEQRWQLECGDLYFAIGRPDKATDLWTELTTADKIDPELLCRATIRLCGWSLVQGQPLPLEIWAPATVAEEFPEEARLLARYVTGGLVSQELEAGLLRLGAPRIFSDAEWEIARALRARAEGRIQDAQQLLWSAVQKAAVDRSWPNYLVQTERKPPQ